MSMENDDAFTQEIVEIFVEEVREVIEQIEGYLPNWRTDAKDFAALKEIRRAFHTLKGSGRMVQADELGELAWAVENMLNRVLDGSLDFAPLMIELVEQVLQVVPALLDAFCQKQTAAAVGVNIQLLIDQADALREGGEVNSLDGLKIQFAVENVSEVVDSAAEPSDGFSAQALDGMQQQMAALLTRMDEVHKDWLQMHHQMEVMKKAVKVLLSKGSSTQKVDNYFQQTDREMKELKYFLKTTSEHLQQHQKQAQQRLSAQVEKDLHVLRTTVAELKAQQTQTVSRSEAQIMIKVKIWALGSAISFSALVLLASIFSK